LTLEENGLRRRDWGVDQTGAKCLAIAVERKKRHRIPKYNLNLKSKKTDKLNKSTHKQTFEQSVRLCFVAKKKERRIKTNRRTANKIDFLKKVKCEEVEMGSKRTNKVHQILCATNDI
jgi:hypothetical protein